jgi:hypothetical protein
MRSKSSGRQKVLYLRYFEDSLAGMVIEQLRREAKENKEHLNSKIGKLILFSHPEKIDSELVDAKTLKEVYWESVSMYAGKLETSKCLLSGSSSAQQLISR